jgi:hypothetical protein
VRDRLSDARRLVLGTDFPYEPGGGYLRAVDYITDPRITDQEATAVLQGNAAALLGMTRPEEIGKWITQAKTQRLAERTVTGRVIAAWPPGRSP